MKHILQEFFKKPYYIVIILYIMKYYDIMFESDKNIIKIEDIEYKQRFSKDI